MSINSSIVRNKHSNLLVFACKGAMKRIPCYVLGIHRVVVLLNVELYRRDRLFA